MNEERYNSTMGRVQLLVGNKGLEALRDKRIILFGCGGVGSWCAESLVRTGVMHLTIVDSDEVAETNVNRQLMATTKTIGQPKVEAMRQRLLDINPDADITALQQTYSEETDASFCLSQYDYVIDCIDSLKDKASLLYNATHAGRPKVFSSMGAALKLDPTQIKVAEMWKVRGCPLGAALRKKLKRSDRRIDVPVMCVYSEELLDNLGTTDETCDYHPQVNGTVAHITAIFGFTLAGLVIQDILK